MRSLKDNPNEELLRNEDSRVFLVDAGLLEEI